jgi:hypothetical protein
VSVAHGADHYSFVTDICPQIKVSRLACWSFLRIRVAPPESAQSPSPSTVGDLCAPEDLLRAEIGQNMFFGSFTLRPNLSETLYAFTSQELLGLQGVFHLALEGVDTLVKQIMPSFMPLIAKSDKAEDVYQTIPASIQY